MIRQVISPWVSTVCRGAVFDSAPLVTNIAAVEVHSGDALPGVGTCHVIVQSFYHLYYYIVWILILLVILLQFSTFV